MSNYIKATYFEDDDLKVTLEELDGNLMVHVTIYSFNREVYGKLLYLWGQIQERAYWQGYEEIYTYTLDNRVPGILQSDGEQIGVFQKDGHQYKVWKWDLKSDWELLPSPSE